VRAYRLVAVSASPPSTLAARPSQALASTETFDPVAGAWSAGPTMNQARGVFFFAAYGTDQFLAAGGGGGMSTTLSTAEVVKFPRR
jgi:hypothetical protein